MTATTTSRRPRRADPDRKDRIADATVDVIAEHGVAGTTHRRVAAAADVPLGSMTYHFDGLADLLRHAFARHARRSAAEYATWFDGVTTRAALADAVTAMVVAGTADERAWTVNFELYLAAQRDPALRAVTEGWMQASRDVLQRVLDPETARGLDALIEGLMIHRGLSTVEFTRAGVHRAVATFLGVAA